LGANEVGKDVGFAVVGVGAEVGGKIGTEVGTAVSNSVGLLVVGNNVVKSCSQIYLG
jgi:hypothetical protein